MYINLNFIIFSQKQLVLVEFNELTESTNLPKIKITDLDFHTKTSFLTL